MTHTGSTQTPTSPLDLMVRRDQESLNVEDKILNCIIKHNEMYLTGPTAKEIAQLEGIEEVELVEAIARLQLKRKIICKLRATRLRYFSA